MKNKNLSCVIIVTILSININAQIGINTTTPASTLDITAKNATGTTTNVDGLLVPRVDRQRAQSMAGVPVSTMIYVNNIGTGAQSGTAANIDTVGYYYFNGSLWVKFNSSSASGINLYNSDGTLTGNRTVTQGSNTLAFKANSVNAFSVNNVMSVDAANNRLGIGTNTPQGLVHAVADNAGGGAENDFYVDGFGSSKSAAIFVGSAGGTFSAPTNLTNGDEIGGYFFKPRMNNQWFYASSGMSSQYKGDGTSNLTNLIFRTSETERMVITEQGNIGIGTGNPRGALDIYKGTAGLVLPANQSPSNITNPAGGNVAIGTIIYDLTADCVKVYKSTGWSGCLCGI